MSIDVYTPWRESTKDLASRTVGREDVLESLRHGGRGHIAGDQPVHRYVFGPRGSGKSHVLALVLPELQRLADAVGRQVVLLGEDVPEVASADDLWARLAPPAAQPSWQSWGQEQDPAELQGAILLIEGLDRQLHALREAQQKRLRKLIQENQVWVVGTGISLGQVFTRKAGAFYGFFSPWPLESLTDEAAGELLARLVSDEAQAKEAWPARKQALVGLAGGSPRTLVALAASCAERPEAWASDHLHAVVQQFTAHYQMRFRDLNPTGQRVVEQITLAPGALSPSDVGELLHADAKSVGVAMRRLLDEGVLTVRHEGRRAMYTVAEPLFRFWYEYRTAPWSETRVGWLARLIEEVLAPHEVIGAWLDNPDPHLREPLALVIGESANLQMRAWSTLLKRAADCADDQGWDELLERGGSLAAAAKSDHERGKIMAVAVVALEESTAAARLMLTILEDRPLFGGLTTLLKFGIGVLEGSTSPRRAFRRLLAGWPEDEGRELAGLLGHYIVQHTLGLLRRESPQGRPWKLSTKERRQLARIPGLRALFLTRGKFGTHPPILDPADIATDDYADSGYLLNAAHSRRHGPLFDAALRGRSILLRCSRPALPAPAAHEGVARACAGMFAEERGIEDAWSWAASWAFATNRAYSDLIEIASSAPDIDPERVDIAVAVGALGLQRMDRLDALLAAISTPKASEMLMLGRSLAASVQGREVEDLHVELRSFVGLTEAAPVEAAPGPER